MNISTFMVWQLSIFWLVLCLSIIVLLVTQHINTERLLYARTVDGRKDSFSYARLQLLLVILLGVAIYLIDLYQAPERNVIEGLPTAVLILLGFSNAIYLYSKFKSANRNSFNKERP
ncbi:MAG TPA: hypothetical protein VL381_04200 [Rhodocyclaceae bacterium]|nr:hypothetical protein [Rhodocyclaceae bacterium]